MTQIDTGGLLEQITPQRWFGAKDRSARAVSLVDLVEIDPDPGACLALVRVAFDDGDAAIYHFAGKLHDGRLSLLDDLEPLGRLGELMAAGVRLVGINGGGFVFGGPGLDPLAPPGGGSVRAMGAEQSNSSIVLDDAIAVKLYGRVAPGPNPDVELVRLLTNEGFEHVPPHVGELSYRPSTEDSAQIDLALAQRFVEGGRDGWADTVDRLAAFLGDRPDDAFDPDLADAAEQLEEISDLGAVTAELHVLLAREEMEPELSPEPIEPSDLKAWIESTRASLESLSRRELPELQALHGRIDARLDELQNVSEVGLKTRVHGDLHLGQILHTPRGWMLLDFEGEPARSLDERRAKYSPLKDVAGMLRSLDYAVEAALRRVSEPEGPRRALLEKWAVAWDDAAREAFLGSYQRTAHEGRFLPADRDELALLLDLFEIDKALYEITYELGHRPDWVAIPLAGLAKVIERGTR